MTKHVDKVSEEAKLAAAKKAKEKEQTELDRVVQQLETKKTVSTLEKTSFDWEKHKTDAGLEDELRDAARDGYVEKQEFLQRVDVRTFEQERSAREAERAKRAVRAAMGDR